MYIVEKVKNWSFISLTMSVLAMFLWIIPALGYSLAVMGVFFGLISLRAQERDGAVSGIIIGILAILLAFIRSALVYFYG